jgi:4-aminobutyrate aminotransferase/(S)-3-amino-2-methylpropionate transaminase
MGLSEIPPPPEITPGFDLPELLVRPPGPQSRTWLTRFARRSAPMGPSPSREERIVKADVPGGTIVLAQAKGMNLIDVDSNRYVDLACGFGSLLLGHGHESVARALEMQGHRLMQGLGDVYPSDAKIGLLERLARFHSDPDAQVILGQSGADAVTAAIKSAVLHTGKFGLVAFGSSYHGLSYGALSVTDLRESYRAPFAEHLPSDVSWIPYPKEAAELDASLEQLRVALRSQRVAAVIVEPILGRGGVIVPPQGFLTQLSQIAHHAGAVVIADEIWTGLGRTGAWLASSIEPDFAPDLICLGKGLGGGLPISACIGSRDVMAAWSQDSEVVHTSTFAGAPLACTAALATLDVLGRKKWIERADEVGNAWILQLRSLMKETALGEIRGRGFMIGMDASALPGGASALQRALLERGFVTTTGGGKRDVLVITPALNITTDLLMAFEDSLKLCVRLLAPGKRASP